MCARLSINWTTRKMREYLQEAFRIDNDYEYELPRYNIAPSQNLLCVIYDGVNYRVGPIVFGYSLPNATSQSETKIVNARAETILSKPSFKESFQKHRCIVLADGYYEWNSEKQPFRITSSNEDLLFIAGIYEVHTVKDQPKQSSCAILTTSPIDVILPIHHRMPLLFTLEQAKQYLNPRIQDASTLAQYQTFTTTLPLQTYPVTKKMNSFRFENEECVKPIVISNVAS